MKKLKLKTIINPDFSWAMSTIMNSAVPAKAAYWLSRIFKKVQAHEKEYNEVRINTLKKYCEPAEEGAQTPFKVNDKNEAVFKSKTDENHFRVELEDLLEQEVEVPTLAFNLLGDECLIESRILVILDDIIVEG